MENNSAIKNFLKGKTDKTSLQFFRYVIAGGTAWIADFSVLALLTELYRIHYLISAAVAFIIGLATNYTLSVKWVFSRRKFEDRRLEFIVFASIGLVGLLLNELFIWFFTEHVHFHYLISKIVSTAFVFFWNFGARKTILFR